MKRVSVYILFALMTGPVTASPTGSLLKAASFPKTADDLTFAQRVDLLTEGYEPFDTVFENGVCVQNCPYVGITLKNYEARLVAAAQQVEQDLSELGYTDNENSAAPQGLDTATVNKTVHEILAQVPEFVDSLSEEDKTTLASVVLSDEYQAQYSSNLNIIEQNIMKSVSQYASKQILLDVADEDIRDLKPKKRKKNTDKDIEDLMQKILEELKENDDKEIRLDSRQQKPFKPNGSGNTWPGFKEKPNFTQGDTIPVGCPIRLNPVSVSSEQGMRKLRTESKARMHQGIDLAASVGTTLYAPADGVVVEKKVDGKGLNKGYGRYLVIQHDRQYYTLYGHLDSWLVEKGAHVSAGQPIAKSGNTGSSSGPHLHYEVTLNGPSYNGGTSTDPRKISRCPYSPAQRKN